MRKASSHSLNRKKSKHSIPMLPRSTQRSQKSSKMNSALTRGCLPNGWDQSPNLERERERRKKIRNDSPSSSSQPCLRYILFITLDLSGMRALIDRGTRSYVLKAIFRSRESTKGRKKDGGNGERCELFFFSSRQLRRDVWFNSHYQSVWICLAGEWHSSRMGLAQDKPSWLISYFCGWVKD